MQLSLLRRGGGLAPAMLVVAQACSSQPVKQDDPCLASLQLSQLIWSSPENLDLLLVLDDSPRMAGAQAKLRGELPHLVRSIASVSAWSPADIHVAIVSTDMGAPRAASAPAACAGLGQDGLLQHAENRDSACAASYPIFLSFTPNLLDLPDPGAARLADDLACALPASASGCGFTQPLEAALKALWPSKDPALSPSTGPIRFLTDPVTGLGGLGHGDRENAGFLRNDPLVGVSLVAVVVISAGDDCSVARPALLSADVSVGGEGLRCARQSDLLQPIARYVDGLKALRPGNENLVAFSAIAGVPPDLVSTQARTGIDFAFNAQREAFYGRILDDPRMRAQPDPQDPSKLSSACQSDAVNAEPALRLVQMAQRFGENGGIASICDSDFSDGFDPVVAQISKSLAVAHLCRPQRRRADKTLDCRLLWELPAPGGAPPGTPTRCKGHNFLTHSSVLGPSNAGSVRETCEVRQLPIDDRAAVDRLEPDQQGWYYDDFSDYAKQTCPQGGGRVMYTAEALPPVGVSTFLMCRQILHAAASDAGAADDASCRVPGLPRSPFRTSRGRTFDVGAACLPEIVPETGFDDREAYVLANSRDCSTGACLIYRLRGDPRPECVPGADTVCADPHEVENRIYCSCRCAAPGASPSACACPTGYSCIDTFAHGDPGFDGSYCVKDGTFTQ